MQFRYSIFFILPLCFAAAPVGAQNTPVLEQLNPSGSVTSTTLPSSLHTTAQASYVRSLVPTIPITDANAVSGSSPAETVRQSIVYKDGFSRTVQSVQLHVNSGANPHLVQPVDTRFRQDELSFLPYVSSSTAYDKDMYIHQYNYTFNAYADELYTAYARSTNLSDLNGRTIKKMAPGRSQVGQGRGVTVRQTTNATDEVKAWGLDGNGQPISYGSYAAGMLFGSLTTDAMDGETLVYTDRDGRTVLQKVKQSTLVGSQGVTPVYAYTTYIYNELGRLAWILPPRATAAATTSLPAEVRDSLCYQYLYDRQGRIKAQRFPGQAGFTEVVYDPKQRQVMRRTPNELGRNQWELTFYDAQGRVKATSLLDNNTMNRQQWQDYLDEGYNGQQNEPGYYWLTPEGEQAYPSETAIADNTMMSYTYYDNYDLADPAGTRLVECETELSFTEMLATADAHDRAVHNHGRITGGKLRILAAPGADPHKTGAWRETVSYYDKKGRVINTYSLDSDPDGNPVHHHYTGLQYDFSGRVMLTKHTVINHLAADGRQKHVEIDMNYYHASTGRLIKTTRKTNEGIWKVQSLYTYDEQGRGKRTVLGNYGEVQDFDYNIRGQLTGINGHYTRTGNRQGESRSFGELLRYDYGFTLPRYDGKIAGMIWRGAGSGKANAYGYSYDYGGRLGLANYNRLEPAGSGGPTSGWRKNLADYTVSNLTYDLDGNILTMDQRGVAPGTGIVDMDQLSYTYATNSNRLLKVVDNASFHDLGDFNNTNGGDKDYAYDADGNLAADANKGLETATYNHQGKPVTVEFDNGSSISYSYDAAGTKVQELVVDVAQGVTRHTDYVGNFVYTDDRLGHVLTGLGRSVYNRDSEQFDEEYFVKDHLGNVRSTVAVRVYPVEEYLGTYELASAHLEGLFFDRHNEIREENPLGSGYVGKLDGSDPDRRIGTAALVRVMAGDKVEMNVNNFYDGYDPGKDAPVAAADVLGAVISVLSGGAGSTLPGEGHDPTMVGQLFSTHNYGVLDGLLSATADPSRPKAYLNYVLFDENMAIVKTASGGFQANGSGSWQEIGTTTPMEIPENGYLAVYLSNATQMAECTTCGTVSFDQLVLRLSRGTLKEEVHYYPHGLPMAGMGGVAANFKENRHKYQGNEYIKDIGLNWMDFHARQYDPQLGRFLGVDPLADQSSQEVRSPYAAMGNDPVSMVDPLGLENTVYMINLPSSGISNDNMRSMVGTLNNWFAEFGIDAQFVLFEPMLNSTFSMSGVGHSDGVIVFGEKNDVSGYIINQLGIASFRTEWENNNSGTTLLGVSGVNVGDVRKISKNNDDDFLSQLIFTIFHEIGHYSRSKFTGAKQTNGHNYDENSALRWPGHIVQGKLKGGAYQVDGGFYDVRKDSKFKSIIDFLNPKYNKTYITEMKNFFNSGYAKDYYNLRIKYPTISPMFYKYLQP